MKQGQEKNGAQRLDKLIGNQGQYTRSQVKDLVRQGRVSWNGSVVRRAEQKVMPGDDIRIDGKPVIVRSHIYLMMNKPAGVVSASRDPRAGTVVDLVPEQWQRRGLFPAGRLDKDTTGFLLITDDGEFAHRMLAPKKHIPKVYLAQLEFPFDPALPQRFACGIQLGDGTLCQSAQVSLECPGERPVARVVLHEGMYHQVKRMFAACGNRVLSLRRIQIGGLALDEQLAPGECREILPKELESILYGF